jgi:Cutinase
MKKIQPLAVLLCAFASQAVAQPHEEKLKQLYSCIYDRTCESRYLPTGTIEQKYYASGPYRVLNDTTETACDSLGNKCTIYYPDPASATFKFPIVTWGNGTNATPESYAYLLKHLASWGFVVIATHEKFVLTNGNGKTLVDSARLLVRANTDPSLLGGVFHQKLNVNNIATVGHSQGAAGAVVAMIQSAGLIKTAVPIELPAMVFCTANCFDIATLTSGSIFLITGAFDFIAPPTQASGAQGQQSIAAYYQRIPNQVVKLMATVRNHSHRDPHGQPDCTDFVLCTVGVHGFLAYPTAWLIFQLQGDETVRSAFVRGTGEMFLQHSNWAFVESNISP